MVTNNPNNEQNNKTQEDLTGRDKLVLNVIFNWTAYFVYIVAGFIMPRLIDRKLGQELLGIWDFAWSLTGYFGLVQLGISSSVNRYIAKYHTIKDISGINRIASTSSFLLGISGFVVFIMTVTISLMLPLLFSVKLGDNLQQAQWVVFFIGMSLAFQMAFAPFNGIITGFHRWGLHNFIKSAWYLIIVAGMIISLLKGGGLRSLAIITFAGQILENITRVIFAYRICKGLHISPSLINIETMKKQFLFGGKTLIPSISNLLLNQTTSILIIAYLGPASLALYSRPRSLVFHINTLVSKMSMTLVPTISSLQSSNNFKEIRKLLISSVKYSLYLVLPIILIIVIFGDAVMQLWMGPNYANGLLPAILALGYMAYMVQIPALNILGGLNSHGRAGIAMFIVSMISAGLTFFALGYLRLGIVGAAATVALPLAIMNFFYIPLLVCKRVDLDLKKYFLSVIKGPAIHILPFAFCLITARYIYNDSLLIGLLLGILSGSVVLFIIYFRNVLPVRIKNQLFM